VSGIRPRGPAFALHALGLADHEARGSRRIEIGSGLRPQPGYIHVDSNPLAPHVEAFAFAWELPFPDGWGEEILAIHVLEHVRPPLLARTLAEWRRVLAHGGVLRVHVPDSATLMRTYLAADDTAVKWSLIGAILGMYGSPEVKGPGDLAHSADHQVLFDAALLSDVLTGAGFTDIRDRTQEVEDVHTVGWRPLVERLSIVMEARNP
jgi:hypothetical protein